MTWIGAGGRLAEATLCALFAHKVEADRRRGDPLYVVAVVNVEVRAVGLAVPR